ncbi:MAG TPA: tripartite tricarboxylate transporter substrate binding protein [Burkholderiales bacterium]|nr:tripartite tricarboxylate transporter substrate binding protein [Burkholderiales bacterium]
MQRFVTVALAALAAGSALAQTQYPARPIRLVFPFPAGGNVDTLGRVFAKQLEAQVGQPVVIDNRAGANGILGIDIVAKAVPDGYTIMYNSFSFVINPSIYKKLPYDTERDFVPITNPALGLGYVLAANPSSQIGSVKELLAMAKKSPLRYSSPGIGNGQHLAGELLARKAGIQLLHVPYKGGGPSLTAALGGEVQLTFTAAAVGAPHFKSGKLKALGFSGASRLPALPDVPTIAEAGLPDFNYDSGWHGLFAPAKTPAAIVEKLHAESAKAVHEPKVKDFLASGGYEARADPPPQFAKAFRADIRKYGDIVKAARIEPQ